MNNNSSRGRRRIYYEINIKALFISVFCFGVVLFLCAITWKPSYIKYVRDFEKEWHTKAKCTYTLLNKEFLPASKGEGECWFILKNSKEKISLRVDKKTYLSNSVGDILTFRLTKCDRYRHSESILSVPILYYILIVFISFIVFVVVVDITAFNELKLKDDGSDLVIPRRIMWTSFWIMIISGIIVNILAYA